jgi:hypothetical protein
MSDERPTIKAADVRIGDRISYHDLELTVTRIDPAFLGMDLLAFVEDSPEQWFKLPLPPDVDVFVLSR